MEGKSLFLSTSATTFQHCHRTVNGLELNSKTAIELVKAGGSDYLPNLGNDQRFTDIVSQYSQASQPTSLLAQR